MMKSTVSFNDRQITGRQTVYQRGNQRGGSPHYVFLYSDGEYSEDEENIPLQNRHQSTSLPRKVEVIKIQLQPEDTLQALSLKYHCSVSELKRINHIHKDNEIFAHRSIKVPVVPYCTLSESLNEIKDDGISHSTSETEKPTTSREEQILNLITTPIVVHPRNSEISNIILNSILQPANEISDNVEDAEDAQLLSLSDQEITPKAGFADSFSCSGADWGFSWPQLLGVSLLLGLGVPFIYILYIAEDSKHSLTAVTTAMCALKCLNLE